MSTDPLGLISNQNVARALHAQKGAGPEVGAAKGAGAPNFKEMMLDELRQVNEMQTEATDAVIDLTTGKRTDYDAVVLAAQKADMAFQMLLQVRNKVMEAYNEVKQIRV